MAEKEGFELYTSFPFHVSLSLKVPIIKGFQTCVFILSPHFPAFVKLLGVKIGVRIVLLILYLIGIFQLFPVFPVSTYSTFMF